MPCDRAKFSMSCCSNPAPVSPPVNIAVAGVLRMPARMTFLSLCLARFLGGVESLLLSIDASFGCKGSRLGKLIARASSSKGVRQIRLTAVTRRLGKSIAVCRIFEEVRALLSLEDPNAKPVSIVACVACFSGVQDTAAVLAIVGEGDKLFCFISSCMNLIVALDAVLIEDLSKI